MQLKKQIVKVEPFGVTLLLLRCGSDDQCGGASPVLTVICMHGLEYIAPAPRLEWDKLQDKKPKEKLTVWADSGRGAVGACSPLKRNKQKHHIACKVTTNLRKSLFFSHFI